MLSGFVFFPLGSVQRNIDLLRCSCVFWWFDFVLDHKHKTESGKTFEGIEGYKNGREINSEK